MALECMRQSESCLYTSTSMFIWLRFLRRVRVACIVTSLSLGGIASWRLLTESDAPSMRVFVAACALLAGLIPTVYSALSPESAIGQIARSAAAFKNLQDRFRQAARVASRKPYGEFEREFRSLMKQLERTRKESVTPPEWCFKFAQKKVKAGDYSFDVDADAIDSCGG